jgi:hypothetical protein
VILGYNTAAASATDHSSRPVDIPVVLSAHTSSAQNDPSWGNVGPQSDEEAALSSRFLDEKMATLNSAVDYLFSLVEHPPTSAWEVLQFSFVAVFIVGFVFVSGTACYWALHIVDLRDQTASIFPNLLPIGTETALPASESEDCDVPSIISDIVQSVLTETTSPDNSSSFVETMTMEILAFATEIAQVRSDAMNRESKDLRNEMGKVIENNKSEINRVAEQGDHQIVNVKNESEAHLETKMGDLQPKVDSKADISIVLELENKLDKVTANAETAAQEMAKSVSTHDTSLSKVFKNFRKLQSDIEKLEKNLSKQHSENGRLVKKLEEQSKAYEVQASKVTEEADQRVAKIMDEFKTVKNALLEKADNGICTRLEGKITDVEGSFESKFGKLQTNLDTTQKDLVSKTETVSARIEKQQVDLDDVKDQLGSEVDIVGKKIEEQQGSLEQAKKMLPSKVESKAFKELENQLSGFVKNRQLGELKQQVDKISSQVEKKADSSTVAALSKQAANKLAANTFVAFKTQTKDELSALSKNLDIKAAKEELNVLVEQISTKASMEDLSEVKEVVDMAHSELKSVAGQLPTMVAIEKFNRLEEVVDVAQSELRTCKAQLLEKVTMEDFAQLKETMAKAQSDLRSVAERLREKAEIVDLRGIDKTVENMQSGLTDLEKKLPVIEGMDFSKIKDNVNFFKRQTEDIRRLVENKVEDRTFAELESRVDSMAEKSSLAEFRASINEKVADMLEALSLTTGAHLSNPNTEKEIVELGASFAGVSFKAEDAAKPSTVAGKPKGQNECKPSETPTGTPVAPSCKPLASESSVMSKPAKEPAPTTPSVAVQQNTTTKTSQDIPSTTAAAQMIPGESEQALQKTTAPVDAQIQSNGSDDSAQPVQNIASASSPSKKTSVNAVSQPSDQSLMSIEENSNFHEPAITIDPEAAAKGATALMASRFAPPERPPLADKTNVPRASTPGTGKAVETASAPLASTSNTTSSSSLAESKWAPPQQAQRSAPPGGMSDSKWAPPQEAQRSGPSAEASPSLTSSRWAQAPDFLPTSATTRPSTQLMKSRWGDEPETEVPVVQSRMSDRWSGANEETCDSSVPKFAPQLALQDLSPTLAEKMRMSLPSPVSCPRTCANLIAELTTLPSTGQASASSQAESSFALQQSATSIEAANTSSAVPAGPKTPKVPAYPFGAGPGPNGGQKKLTKYSVAHNARQRNRNELNKALEQFTPAQQQHARQFQDPVTLLFARGSHWSWLNPIFTQKKRYWQVGPPPGWIVPTPRSSGLAGPNHWNGGFTPNQGTAYHH